MVKTVQYNVIPSKWLITLGSEAIWELWCWQNDHSAVALVRLTLVWESSWCWAYDLSTMTICSWGAWAMKGSLEKKVAWYLQNKSSYPSSMKLPFDEHSHKINISSHFFFCPFREVYPHIFSSNFLATNFPIAFLSSPWSSSQTIGHSYELVYNSVSGHLLFHAKWTIRCIAQSSAYLEELLSSVSLGVSWKGAAMLQLSTFGEYLHIVQNHQ